MDTITFHGIVYPYAIEGEGHPTTIWKSDELDIEVRFDVEFKGETFLIKCDLIRFDMEKHFGPLKVRALHLAQAFVELITIRHGQAVSVALLMYDIPDGTRHHFVAGDKNVIGLMPSIAADRDLTHVLTLSLRDPVLSLAIRDLADTLRNRSNAAVNFGRCIETIRNHFAPHNKKGAGWEGMRTNLNVDESYLHKIMDAAKDPRHGHRVDEEFNMQEIAVSTWKVMDRYLAYRKAGNQPLSEPDFPPLV